MKKYYVYAAVSILGWSTVATVVKLLLGSLNSFQVLSISSLFAAAFLLVVNIATGNIKKLKSYTAKDYLTSVLIGLPGAFLYYVFYYTGTSFMPASQAFIVNYLWPIMSVLFACIILKEKMTAVKIIALLCSFAGVIIVVGKDLFGFEWQTLIGAGFCALGAVSYGIFTALNQKSSYDKRNSLMIAFFSTFVLTTAINLASGNMPSLSGVQVLGIAWNGIVSIGIANTSWQLALESKDTAKISNLAYITPFLSLIWTWLILKEQISVFSLIGLAVIMLGILIQIKFGKKKDEKRDEPAAKTLDKATDL